MKKNKKGPLSKAEKTQINDMLSHGDDVATISDATSRSEAVVTKFVKSLPTTQTNEPTPVTEKIHASPANAGSMMARKESHGVVMMTEAASARGDDTRPQRLEQADADHQSPPRYHRHIHKIKED